MDNVMTLLGASNHSESEREKLDYYATPEKAVWGLLSGERNMLFTYKLRPCFLDPCAGNGELNKAMRSWLMNRGDKSRYDIYELDIVKRKSELDFVGDFLSYETLRHLKTVLPDQFDIIMNPPYSQALGFIEQSLALIPEGGKVYALLRLLFLEGQERHFRLFHRYPPSVVNIFSKRIICAKNGDFEKYKSGAQAFAWFIWEKGYDGEPVIKWI